MHSILCIFCACAINTEIKQDFQFYDWNKNYLNKKSEKPYPIKVNSTQIVF